MGRVFTYVFGLLVLLLSAVNSRAQVPVEGKIMTGAEVQGTDTIPVFFLNEVVVTERLTGKALRQYRREARRNERRDADYARLRYNVYKVYPYAVTAASLLKGVDAQLDKMADKKEKKAYLKKLEGDLNKRFKGELEQFTIQQGIILVKLIDRQTGRNCFSIIQEVKGGFNAVVWQSVALLFSNNLKREYDPLDRDRDIEAIVQEIEAIRKP